MGKYFDKSIKVTTGFGLSGKSPLDARTICSTIADRDAIPDIQKYEGMCVYVEDVKLNYQYINNVFVELSVSKVIGAAAASLGINEYAIKANVNAGKLELSVIIDRIDGGYYD